MVNTIEHAAAEEPDFCVETKAELEAELEVNAEVTVACSSLLTCTCINCMLIKN